MTQKIKINESSFLLKDRSPLVNSEKQLKVAFPNFPSVAFICQILSFSLLPKKHIYLTSAAGGSKGAQILWLLWKLT